MNTQAAGEAVANSGDADYPGGVGNGGLGTAGDGNAGEDGYAFISWE